MTREQALERACNKQREHENSIHKILHHGLVGNWQKELDKEYHRLAKWERIIERLETE